MPGAGPWQQPYSYAPRSRSRVPIIAGILVVVVVSVIAIALVAYLGAALGPLVGRTALEDLAVGQCFNGGRAPSASSDSLIFGVEVVPCSEPHTSELAATFDYPGGGSDVTYPGLAPVSAYAEAQCYDRFTEYVGVSYELSTLSMTFVYPRQPNWAVGDYSVQCVVHPPDGQDQVSESYQNSRR